MDFAANGDVYQKISKSKKESTYFEEDAVWKILLGSLSALNKLHQMKIFHRDIKSANIFLADNNVALLGDLNVSKVAKQGLLYTQTGTPYYASPEVWNDKPYDSKSDIWSLGCVMYEVLALEPPFRANDMKGLWEKVNRGKFMELPERYTKGLKNIIKKMIIVDATKRPSCDDMLSTNLVQSHATRLGVDI